MEWDDGGQVVSLPGESFPAQDARGGAVAAATDREPVRALRRLGRGPVGFGVVIGNLGSGVCACGVGTLRTEG